MYAADVDRAFVANVRLQWIDHDIGYGVFANKPIFKGELIGEYTGLLKHFSKSEKDEDKSYQF